MKTTLSLLALLSGLGLSPALAQTTQTFTGPTGPNIVTQPVLPNDTGFPISIGAVDTTAAAQATQPGLVPRETVGRLLDAMGVQIRFDRLGATPKLNVATQTLADTAAPNTPITFQTATNYPGWIATSTLVIKDVNTNRDVARLPVTPNGQVTWQTPATSSRLAYYLEVADANGRRDLTRARPLDITQNATPGTLDAQSLDTYLQDDATARRQIPVRGGAVVVTGQDMPEGTTLLVMGEHAQVAPYRAFALERILPPGTHGISVEGSGNGRHDRLEETVTIPNADWFYTAMVDLTIGRDFQDGRVAGFADGTLANGIRIRASIDTNERDLSDLFADFWARDPQRVLRDIDPSQPFLTYGDDSRREDLAPTSGRLYANISHDRWYAQWGDFTTDPLLSGLARNSRTLYGASAAWESLDRTAAGNARIRAAGYAATAETAAQRDVFRGTGGSAYFLSRRDVVRDSERITIEYRDRISGQVLQSQPLTPGVDYRLNSLQGTVILNAPLMPDANTGSNADTAAYLVVGYEFVPVGGADGLLTGGRLEGWVADTVRLGVEGQLDASTMPDTQVVGLDLLYAPTPTSSLLLGAATSKGPGLGQTVSANGGLTQVDQNPVGGNARANAYRLEGTLDLADISTQEGSVSVFLSHEERGFASPDGVVNDDRTRGRVAGNLVLSPTRQLTFGARFDDTQNGLQERDATLGMRFGTEDRYTDLGLRFEERSGVGADLGTRSLLEARHTVVQNPDLTWWVYGQATLHTQNQDRDDRLGAGLEKLLSETTTLLGDLSYGTRGWGAEIGIGQTTEGNTQRLTYRLDPDRRFDATSFAGRDNGVLVISGDRTISPTVRQTAEVQYDAFGNQPSQTSTYGLAWTPSDQWAHEFGFLYGQGRAENGLDRTKQGLSYGIRRQVEGSSMVLRAEWIQDRSDDPTDAATNFDTYLIKGTFNHRTSEDWHLMASLDAALTQSPVGGVSDGRYIEGKIGYAYRPVDSDRTIALVSYTFLDDRPTTGQRNFDGDVDGDGQRSHILNASVTQQLADDWTLGAKYGARHRTLYPRGGGATETSWTQLGVLRLDYHLTHEWDAMLEGRVMWHDGGATEQAALVGITRAVSPNLRVGLGYAWGGVSDDLRQIERGREGLFLNLTASF